MRRRLTPEEREIRESRGIGLKRFWAFPTLVITILIVAMDTDLFVRCVGDPIEGHGRGRGAAAIRMALVLPCSPYLLTGSHSQFLKFIVLWLPVPFMVMNWRWAQRHKAYWDQVRAREKVRRAERAKQRKSDNLPDAERRTDL
ncbi:hypothetical protein BG023_112101 [Porphyrobacter sp. LM 6]|nr:hypothetical protein BG023_112101 [Porphyrobacter sp. LM 6]